MSWESLDLEKLKPLFPGCIVSVFHCMSGEHGRMHNGRMHNGRRPIAMVTGCQGAMLFGKRNSERGRVKNRREALSQNTKKWIVVVKRKLSFTYSHVISNLISCKDTKGVIQAALYTIKVNGNQGQFLIHLHILTKISFCVHKIHTRNDTRVSKWQNVHLCVHFNKNYKWKSERLIVGGTASVRVEERALQNWDRKTRERH